MGKLLRDDHGDLCAILKGRGYFQGGINPLGSQFHVSQASTAGFNFYRVKSPAVIDDLQVEALLPTL